MMTLVHAKEVLEAHALSPSRGDALQTCEHGHPGCASWLCPCCSTEAKDIVETELKRDRAAAALDATLDLDGRGPRTFDARRRVATALDLGRPPAATDVRWLETVAKRARFTFSTPVCFFCDRVIAGPSVNAFGDNGLDRAHGSCRENRDEAAYDRSVEDFYGGKGARPMKEQYREAAEIKRRLG